VSISKAIWLLQVSLLLYPVLLEAHEASSANVKTAVEVHSSNKAASNKSHSPQGDGVGADHRKAIEAHIRRSDQQIRLLLRSASMSNIDDVLHSMDAIRQGDEACVQHIEHCRNLDASPNTADVSRPLPPFDSDAKL
jgi:hypothetical protein